MDMAVFAAATTGLMFLIIVASIGTCYSCLYLLKVRKALKFTSWLPRRSERCHESSYPAESLINRRRPSICLPELHIPSTLCTVTGRGSPEAEHCLDTHPPVLHDSASPTSLQPEELLSHTDSGYHSHSSSSADSLSTSSSESRLTALEIKDHKLYNLKVGTFDFIEPIGVLECGTLGGVYTDSRHNFSITIPVGAVPDDTVVRIEVGVCSYGPFKFPSNHKPVSAVIWLHVQNYYGFKFQKPIKICLQHCIDIRQEEDIQLLELTFVKANCYADGRSNFEFSPAQGKWHFAVGSNYGTLCMTCFCFACITAPFYPDIFPRVKYSLLTVEPGPTSDVCWCVYFVLCFSLETCIQVCIGSIPVSSIYLPCAHVATYLSTRSNLLGI